MSQQSWFIAFEIPEPVKSKIEDIKNKISKAYGTLSVLKSPAHITIIPPFYWGNGTELVDVVNSFSFQPFSIHLNGYHFFDSKVMYIKIDEHVDLIGLHHAFNTYFFQHYPQLKRQPTFPFHPHVTVGNRDWKPEQFKKCVQDYKDKSFIAKVEFKGLTLYKLVNGKWNKYNNDL